MTNDMIITAVSKIAGKDGKPATKTAATDALLGALIDLDAGGDLSDLLTAYRRMDNASYRCAALGGEANADALEGHAQDFGGLADSLAERAQDDAHNYRAQVAA